MSVLVLLGSLSLDWVTAIYVRRGSLAGASIGDSTGARENQAKLRYRRSRREIQQRGPILECLLEEQWYEPDRVTYQCGDEKG